VDERADVRAGELRGTIKQRQKGTPAQRAERRRSAGRGWCPALAPVGGFDGAAAQAESPCALIQARN
jgi:hypothetical protein